MDALVQANHPDSALACLPVLALFPRGKSDDARVLLRMVRAAQKRWDWKIDALCIESDRPAFEKVVVPGGRLFTRPGLLEPVDWKARGEDAIALIDQRIAEAERASRLPVGRIVAASASTIGRAFVIPVRRRLSSPMARLVLKDNTEPFQIFRRFFVFADDMLEATAPNVVLSFDWVTPMHAAVWLAATRRGIPLPLRPPVEDYFGPVFLDGRPADVQYGIARSCVCKTTVIGRDQ